MTPVHPVSTAGRAERLCLAAAAAALVLVATAFLKVPIPLGYAHLGDAVIFLAALLLPRREAALAAALGSALADFLGGFPLWMGPTLLIKCVMVYIVCAAAGTDRRLLSRRAVLGWILSSLWMAAGYTAFGALLYGSLAAGLSSLPGLLAEGAANTAAACAAALLLRGRLG